MQNQATASGLPATLASNALRTRMLQDPTLLNQMMGAQQAPSPSATAGGAPTPGSSTVPAPTASPSVTKNAFSSLPDDTTRTLAANAAMRAGLPQEAWPAWMATVHNESGWNINALDNQDANGSYDIGPGQINSRTARTFRVGYTPDQLRDPATNLLASAKYFGQQWTAGGADPAKAMAGYNTGDPTKADPDYVSKGMTQLGNWGYCWRRADADWPGWSAGHGGRCWVHNRAGLYSAGEPIGASAINCGKFRRAAGVPPGDPAVLRTMAGKYTDLALAGPTAAAVAQNQNIVIRPGGAARIQTSGRSAVDEAARPDRTDGSDTTGNKTWAYATPPLVIGNHEVEPAASSPITGTNGAPAIAESPAAVAAIHARNQVMVSWPEDRAGDAGSASPAASRHAGSLGASSLRLRPLLVAPSLRRFHRPAHPHGFAATPPPAVQTDIQHICPRHHCAFGGGRDGLYEHSKAATRAISKRIRTTLTRSRTRRMRSKATCRGSTRPGPLSIKSHRPARVAVSRQHCQFRPDLYQAAPGRNAMLPDRFLHQMGNLPDASLSQQLLQADDAGGRTAERSRSLAHGAASV